MTISSAAFLRRLSAFVLLCVLAAACGGSNTPASPSAASTAIALAELTLSVPAVIGGQPLEGTVLLSTAAGRGGASVTLTSSDATVTVPASVVVAEGNTQGRFTIVTRAVTADVTAAISAASGNGSRAVTLRVVTPREPVIDTLDLGSSQVFGLEPVRGTVRLDVPAPAATTITLTSDTRDLGLPASVQIGPGAISTTFTGTTQDVETNVTARVTASAGGQARSATITVVPRPLPPISTLFSLDSPPGEFIGGGRTVRHDPSNALFSANASCGGQRLYINVTMPDYSNSWFMRVYAPKGDRLRTGTYQNVQKAGLHPPDQVGFEISGYGRGCGRTYTDLEVKQAVFAQDGRVSRFHATFAQRCEFPDRPVLRGEISLDGPRFPAVVGIVCN